MTTVSLADDEYDDDKANEVKSFVSKLYAGRPAEPKRGYMSAIDNGMRNKVIVNNGNPQLTPASRKPIPKKLKTIHPSVSASQEHPVNSKRIANSGSERRPNVGRHSTLCRICTHARRQKIEDDFVAWVSPAKIAVDYKLSDRSAIYRHAHALNLFPKRRRNKGLVLEMLMERVNEVEVTASAIVAAVQAAAKIDAQGRWIEHEEKINVNDFVDQMNLDELKIFVEKGTLPSRIEEAIREAGGRVPEEGDDE